MEENKTDWRIVFGGFGLFLLSIVGIGLGIGIIVAAQAFGSQWSETHIIIASVCGTLGAIGGLFGTIIGFFTMTDHWY